MPLTIQPVVPMAGVSASVGPCLNSWMLTGASYGNRTTVLTYPNSSPQMISGAPPSDGCRSWRPDNQLIRMLQGPGAQVTLEIADTSTVMAVSPDGHYRGNINTGNGGVSFDLWLGGKQPRGTIDRWQTTSRDVTGAHVQNPWARPGQNGDSKYYTVSYNIQETTSVHFESDRRPGLHR